VTDRVHPTVQGMQSPPSKPSLDRPTGDPAAQELASPHNPVLSLPKLGQEPVDATRPLARSAFATYNVVNADLVLSRFVVVGGVGGHSP
jgi:hypothetical protein